MILDDLHRTVDLPLIGEMPVGDMAVPILLEMSEDLPLRTISIGGKPYLERYFVGINGSDPVYLHRFVDGDGDRYLHNHPWDTATATIIAGGYRERRMSHGGTVETRHLSAGDQNLLRADDLHQIISVQKETWTLFTHGPWAHKWGFVERWNDDGTPVVRCDPEDGVHRLWWLTAPLGRDHPGRVGHSLLGDPA